ncbi:MAG TPA: protoglobin domain-containing protein [Terrimesophilobacter sp.]|nr:protoglobin domain-containing protein [Terrimesophilobacter sp.]
MNHHPAGYTYGDASLAPSPVSIDTLAQIQRSVLWSEDDSEALRRAGEILVPQTEQILDVWYGFVGANPHLVATFAGSDEQPDGAYLAAVRERFGRWIADLCARPFDEDWLAYQEEIALRHHTTGKNRTDGVDSPSGHVPLSHLIALIVPITVTIRDFLGARGADPAEVDAMYHAWMKAVTLSVVLWTRPYNPELW